MLTTLEKILFLLLVIGSGYFGGKGFYEVYRAIGRGKPDARFDDLANRIRRALWTVFAQRSVFKARPLVSFFHALIFYGFVFYFAVNFVDLLEGFTGIHGRGGAWNFFNLAGDLLTAGVLIGIVAMLLRQFMMRPKDFDFAVNTPIETEVRAGIRRDSLIVASFIIFHVGCRLLFKATQIAQQGSDAFQPVGSLLAAPLSVIEPVALAGLNHFFWWGSLGSIFVFLSYFPFSKHIHIVLAPINLALKKERPGALQPMDFEKEEVFGAAKLEDFTWPRLLDSYSCIMCNRCQDVCPANATGKALSPAAILINERFELNRIFPSFSHGAQSPRPLLEFALN